MPYQTHVKLWEHSQASYNISDTTLRLRYEAWVFKNLTHVLFTGRMKVLMFGWEFPPHISGGLGTACFGLTQSLIREKVKVMFVVPRLFPDQEKEKSFLINASAIADRLYTKPANQDRRRSKRNVQERYTSQLTVKEIQTGFDYVPVAAGISPYNDEHSFPPVQK